MLGERNLPPREQTGSEPRPDGEAPEKLSLPRVLLTAVACLIPVAWVAGVVARLSVNAPFSDEWELVPLLQKQAAGTLRVADVWAQHNEHRSFFPELIMLKLARLTHWDIRAEVVLNLALAAGVLALLLFLLKRTVAPVGGGLFAVAAVAFSWMAFSPRQWENWLWGWEMAWFLCNLGAVAAATILTQWVPRRSPWIVVACASAAAGVASFSLAAGLGTWIAFLVIFAARSELRRGLWLWVPAALATFALYFHRYHSGPGGGLGYTLRHPVQFAAYVLGYVGAPIAGKLGPSIAVGLGVCVIFVAATAYLAFRHPQELRRSIVWVALGLYGLLDAALTASGRLYLGLVASQNSRYTTLSMLVALSALALGFVAARSYQQQAHPAPRLVRTAQVVVIAGLAGVLFLGYNKSMWRLWFQHDRLEVGAACLRSATGPQAACLGTLYPNASIEWDRLQYLRAKGIGGLP